jgi:peptidoglycan/LPS O-acetylase OafA/YrhL
MVKKNYEPAIDGLRTIAILGVIIYHAQITIGNTQLLKGGFLGVDIFFVISGYLISSIIFNEYNETKKFSFLNFYEKRARRLFPALFLMVITCLIFGWYYLLPSSFINLAKSIIYSLGFASNYFFYKNDLEYNSDESLYEPLLHTWSLGIEEQFYIIFPFLLIIFLSIFKKRILFTIIFLFLLSILIAQWSSKNFPEASFYFIHTRAWELLIGTFVAYCSIKNNKRFINKISINLMPKLGIFLILVSFIFYNNKLPHPSGLTLLPVIGVSSIIWFSRKNEFITRILSLKPIVYIGLISYSLYLWHYPIFAYSRTINFTDGDIYKKITIIFSVVIISLISYHFIEKPFRNKSIINKNLFIKFLSLSFIIIITLSCLIIKNNGFKSRQSSILNDNLVSQKPWSYLKDSLGRSCFNRINNFCNFNNKSDTTVFIIGDSHMASIIFDLEDRITKTKLNFMPMTNGGCWYLPTHTKIDDKTNKDDKFCNKIYQKNIKKVISKTNNSIIIFGGNLPNYINSKRFTSHNKISFKNDAKNGILNFANNNHNIIIIYPIPTPRFNVPREIMKIEKEINFNLSNEVNNKRLTYDFNNSKNFKKSYEFLDNLNHENISRIYPKIVYCDKYTNNKCLTHDGKEIFYVDDEHLSVNGSKNLNKLIITEIKKILKNRKSNP